MRSKKYVRRASVSIAMTLIFATLSSISLSCIPLLSIFEEGQSRIIAKGIAAVFWGGLLLMFFAAYTTRSVLLRCYKRMSLEGQWKRNQPVGLVNFSANWRMWILYGITAVGLVLIASDMLFRYVPEQIMFPVLSVTMLSFLIHCVMDGKYYKAYVIIKESANNETSH